MSSKHIQVEFDLEKMDTSGFKDGATYDEIAAWVEKNYGFHVTNLNIDQTQRKCRTTERENTNL